MTVGAFCSKLALLNKKKLKKKSFVASFIQTFPRGKEKDYVHSICCTCTFGEEARKGAEPGAPPAARLRAPGLPPSGRGRAPRRGGRAKGPGAGRGARPGSGARWVDRISGGRSTHTSSLKNKIKIKHHKQSKSPPFQ